MIDLTAPQLISIFSCLVCLLAFALGTYVVYSRLFANQSSSRLTFTLRLSRATANYVLRHQLHLAKSLYQLSSDDRTDRIRAVVSDSSYCRTDLDVELLDLDDSHCTMVVYASSRPNGVIDGFCIFTDFGKSKAVCQMVKSLMDQYVIDKSMVKLRNSRKVREFTFAYRDSLVYRDLVPKGTAYTI